MRRRFVPLIAPTLSVIRGLGEVKENLADQAPRPPSVGFHGTNGKKRSTRAVGKADTVE
jgi:hypothetical protein